MVVDCQADGSLELLIATDEDDQFNESLELVVYIPFARQDVDHV